MRGRVFRNAVRVLGTAALVVVFGSGRSGQAGTEKDTDERLQDLLYREALFHHYQSDDFAAITRLQASRASQPDQAQPTQTQLLLVRMQLAYGLHENTDRILRGLLDQGLPEDQTNRAWYELAQTLFRKGYATAANAALDSLRGRIHEDIAGKVQLLRANVLMALNRHTEAARALENWRGPQALAGYAHFNRGIALLRAGKDTEAGSSLKLVANLRVDDEERLALRDRANLTLGYMALRRNDPVRARDHFAKVRPQGPYSNRALLALGLVEQGQGNTDQALAAWLLLRKRTPEDPAVQESYLAVPYALREQQAPQSAQQYEQAVTALSRELDGVTRAKKAVQEQENFDLLLHIARSPNGAGRPREEASAKALESRYLGRLLASRRFQETSLGHRDLLAILADLEQGLEDMDRLATVDPRATARKNRQAKPSSRRRASAGTNPTQSAETARTTPQPGSAPRPGSPEVSAWQNVPRPQRPARAIPLLPEIELPPEADRTPFPNPDPSGLPDSEVLWLPPAPEVILPEDLDGLPPAPEVVWLPPASTYRPITDEDFAYPDLARPAGSRTDSTRRLVRRTPAIAADPGVPPDAAIAGKDLGGLSAVLDRTDDRIAQIARKLRDQRSGVKDYRALIRALQERARRLRERIAAAIELHERYAKALILDELEDRQSRLEDYLRQARLELAKTYDLDTDAPR